MSARRTGNPSTSNRRWHTSRRFLSLFPPVEAWDRETGVARFLSWEWFWFRLFLASVYSVFCSYPLPFYAVCITATRSCACPIVCSCLLPCLILYIRTQAPTPSLIGGAICFSSGDAQAPGMRAQLYGVARPEPLEVLGRVLAVGGFLSGIFAPVLCHQTVQHSHVYMHLLPIIRYIHL